MSKKIPQKKTGYSCKRLLRLRRAGLLKEEEIKGRLFYDSDELAAVPGLLNKASEKLLGRDTDRHVGRPSYKELAAALGLGGL